jgi:hypothetical protein
MVRPDTSMEQTSTAEIAQLESIVGKVASSLCSVRANYGNDLKQSLASLRTLRTEPSVAPLRSNLDDALLQARREMKKCFDDIYLAVSQSSSLFPLLSMGQLWPCVTPVSLLEQLRSTAKTQFGTNMRKALITYAISITKLQYLLRLKDATLKKDLRKQTDEETNPGHVNWNPEHYPDWLLLEVDGNMLIRRIQVDVALATIFPQSNANSLLQMNMGQGTWNASISYYTNIFRENIRHNANGSVSAR